MATRMFHVWRGDKSGGAFRDYQVDIDEGMVVLDIIHRIQATQAPDLAVRWNCKAGKCGSCSCEINGKPRLSCMTRMNSFGPDETITVTPIKAFPVIKDLVTDVSWNFEQNKRIKPFTPDKNKKDEHGYYMMQEDVERTQEFRKCIECYLCQNVCHVLRDHERKEEFAGPRFFVRVAGLEMHPLDGVSRVKALKEEMGLGYCNITKCCTEVCPEDIHITDNAIIPLKERVVDEYYDPVLKMVRKIFGAK